MPKSPSDNNIHPENASVEESIDWVPIAIAVPHPMKAEIRAAAKRQGLKLSVWGRQVLQAALDGDRRSGEDRRKAS